MRWFEEEKRAWEARLDEDAKQDLADGLGGVTGVVQRGLWEDDECHQGSPRREVEALREREA